MSAHSAHSVHVDVLAERHHAIADQLQAGSESRVEAAEYLAALVEDNFRDSTCDLHVVFAGVDDTDDEWDARAGVDVHAGRKREFVRTALGQPLITIDYVRGESR